MAQEDAWHERWARQLALDQVGEEGQRALGRATAAVVGAGALGSNSAELLARMGVGSIRVMDRDVLEPSNLHRQRVLGEADLDRSKAEALAERLHALVPSCKVEGIVEDVSPSNALGLLEGADIVVDGLDGMRARYVLNDACLELGVPWVYGGVVATGGMAAAFPAGGPCLRCLFPEMPAKGALPTCESEGIHPSVPAVVAGIQVAEATKLLLGQRPPPRLIALDLWSTEWRVVELSKRAGCPACGEGRRDFLAAGDRDTVTTLCGHGTVQISPATRRGPIDLDAKAEEWRGKGLSVRRAGPVLTLDLGESTLHLFASGRALVKGTTEAAKAKSVYARYVVK